MKIKELSLSLSSDDILNFIKIQNKLEVEKVNITDTVKIEGFYKFMNMKVNFQLTLTISKVVKNFIYLNIVKLEILKLNIANILTKKAMDYIIQSFTDIDGITLEGEDFKIEVNKIIDKLNPKDSPLDLSEAEVVDLLTIYDSLEISLRGIKINTSFIEHNKL